MGQLVCTHHAPASIYNYLKSLSTQVITIGLMISRRSTISLSHTLTRTFTSRSSSISFSLILKIRTNPFILLLQHVRPAKRPQGVFPSLSERKQRTSEIEKATQLFVPDPHWPRRSRPTPVGYFTRKCHPLFRDTENRGGHARASIIIDLSIVISSRSLGISQRCSALERTKGPVAIGARTSMIFRSRNL